MERRGWVTDDGKHEVTRLQEAVAEVGGLKPGQPRWQTVQEWVEGKTAPSTRYATLIARALDMTLAELMGVATKEPVYPAWQRFLETPQGQSMSEAERQSLASLLWVHGPPDIAAYKMALAAIRSTSSEG